MSRWVAPQPLELQLWYGDVLVADLHQVFPHQGTWFAPYELKIAPGDGALQDQVLQYIAFADDFNRRIAQGQDHDFAEFDGFGAIADAGSWRVPRPDGGVMPMADRMWFMDGQACWQHPETAPSTEGAANELWAHVVPVPLVRIQEYVLATIKYYGSDAFEFLQLVYPDTELLFPGEEGYDYDQELFGAFPPDQRA